MATPSVLCHVTVLLLWFGCALGAGGGGSSSNPLTGQGRAPVNVTEVKVDVFLEGIRALYSDRNAWEGIHWVRLSWNDSAAAVAIQAATSAWAQGEGECKMPCDSGAQFTGGCCDDVWLPSIEFPNLNGIPQEAVPRHRIWLEPPAGPGSPPTVYWATRIVAEWQSPFDFRAWPFEHQHLLMEMQVPPSLAHQVGLRFGEVAILKNTPHTKGEHVPGWSIAKVFKRVFDTEACYALTKPSSSVFEITSTAGSNGNVTAGVVALPYNGWVFGTDKEPKFTNITKDLCTPALKKGGSAESTAQFAPQILVVDMMVKRTRAYYVLSHILPLLLVDYMVFVVYAMERTNLESRMGVVVTMVLALSALQFTFNFPPAQYLNAVQQLVLTSYVLYFVVAVESMLASHICRIHSRRRRMQRIKEAAQFEDKDGVTASVTTFKPTLATISGDSKDSGDSLTAPLELASGLNTARTSTASRTFSGNPTTPSYNRPRDSLSLPPSVSKEPPPHANLGYALAALGTADKSNKGTRTPLNPILYGGSTSSTPAGRPASLGGAGTPDVRVDITSWSPVNQCGNSGAAGRLPVSRNAGPVGEGLEQLHEDVEQGCLETATPTATQGPQPICEGTESRASGAGGSRTNNPRLSAEILHPLATKPSSGATSPELSASYPAVAPIKPSPIRGNPLRGAGQPVGEGGAQDGLSAGASAGANLPKGWATVRAAVGATNAIKKGRLSRMSATFKRTMSVTLQGAASVPRRFNQAVTQRISRDEAFAQLFAARMDTFFSWFLLVGFSVVVSVLMYVNTQVGDHKLMMYGEPPANM